MAGIRPVPMVISSSSLQVWVSWCWLSAFQRTFGQVCLFPVVPRPGKKPCHHTLSFLRPLKARPLQATLAGPLEGLDASGFTSELSMEEAKSPLKEALVPPFNLISSNPNSVQMRSLVTHTLGALRASLASLGCAYLLLSRLEAPRGQGPCLLIELEVSGARLELTSRDLPMHPPTPI